ncbi:MAG: ParB/RepB/Spo0J family partition protein, partial [Pseudomonadota bacterium]
MARKTERKGLGRGLSALLVDAGETAASKERARADSTLPIEKVRPNPDQPRRFFAEDDLADLSRSIKEKGILQPLIVRVDPNDGELYQIVAGERRWRAAQRAQIHEVPVLIRELTDEEVLELAIIENIQRADLNAIEEALGYRQLMDKFGHTQERLAESLGKSRSHIANLLRLLNLPEAVQSLVASNALSAGHARALVTADDPEA